MDHLQDYELYDLLELTPWSSKLQKEIMRNEMWASLQPYLKNRNTTPKDLFPLSTDENDKIVVGETNLSDEEINNYREIYKNIRLEEWQTDIQSI